MPGKPRPLRLRPLTSCRSRWRVFPRPRAPGWGWRFPSRMKRSPPTCRSLPPGIGFVIRSVDEGGPGRAAGLREFDVLWKIGDQMLVNEGQLAALLRLSQTRRRITCPASVRQAAGSDPQTRRGTRPDAFARRPGGRRDPARRMRRPDACVNVSENSPAILTPRTAASRSAAWERFKVKSSAPTKRRFSKANLRRMAVSTRFPTHGNAGFTCCAAGSITRLEGRMMPTRQPRPRVVPPSGDKPLSRPPLKISHGNALRFPLRLPIFRRMHPDVAKLVEAGRIPKPVGERLSQLAPGNFCIHKSFGAGKVVDWDLPGKKVTIDFENPPARRWNSSSPSRKPSGSPPMISARKKSSKSRNSAPVEKRSGRAGRPPAQSHGGSMTGDALEKELCGTVIPEPFQEMVGRHQKGPARKPPRRGPPKTHRGDRPAHRRPKPGPGARRRFRGRPRHQGHDQGARSHRRRHRRLRKRHRRPQAPARRHRRRRQKGRPRPTRPGPATRRRPR
jgi:hypothetical protein